MGRESELFKAAQTGNTAALEKAFASQLKKLAGGSHHGSGIGSIRSKLHPNIQDSAGCTMLHHAILNGHSDTVTLLLKIGASTKIPDNSGSPPLHLAAWKGDLDIVKMLITQGASYANVNQQNDSDDTALHLASQYGYAHVVEFLLQRHADPLLRNVRNETPLDLAAQYGHLSCVHYLISYSPESLRPTLRGFSPLHLAARNGHSLVALSLINAGISVNTVCERGTALHEAAMCGKIETVELLLDKGVNFDLKDCEDRTVLEVLDQFKADQATEIRKKILAHMDQNEGVSTPPDPKTRSCRVIAVARNTSQPLVEGSSALPFHTGDHIQVERVAGSGVYVGSVRGVHGSFLAEDVLFYTEQDGELVATKERDLHMSSDHAAMTSAQDMPPPTAQNSAAEATNDQGSAPSAVIGPLHHPHSDSVSEEASSVATDSRGEMFELSMCSSQKSHEVGSPEVGGTQVRGPEVLRAADSSTVTSDLVKTEPVNLGPARSDSAISDTANLQTSDPVTPDPKTAVTPDLKTSDRVTPDPSTAVNPDPKTSGPSKGGRIAKRTDSKKMSKKEKKFHLSKDDGRYAELNPINPHEAKMEFGDTLRLNPVGPEFVGVASSEEGRSAVPGPESSGESGDLMGSYYVLEVGNFDPVQSPLPASGTESEELDLRPDAAGMEPGHSPRNPGSSPVPVPGEGGYFMLNTTDPEEDMEAYSYVPKSRVTNYVNAAVLKPGVVSVSPKMSPKVTAGRQGGASPRLHPHLVMAGEQDMDRTGQSRYEGIQSDGRASMYENVCPPGEREVLPVPAAAVVGSAESAVVDRRSMYENVASEAHHSPSPAPSPSPGPLYSQVNRSEVKRSARQRQEVYEPIQLKGRKVNGHSNPQSPDTAIEMSVVQNSAENQFAGLVITASKQLEESFPLPLSPTHMGFSPTHMGQEGVGPNRPRLDTPWDNLRVEREWNQIDSLLEDMSGTIGDHPYPTSPTSISPPVAKSNRAELVDWLSTEGLLSCASPMEVNGFDSLRFLGGGVLAMDDLADIGITTAEDQYNLMAAVSLLAPPPSIGHASTVVEWLGLLDLLELEGKFLSYSLKKISTLWDIELTSVVGVELLGYRKRLQYGIAELRRAHPGWVGHDTTPRTSPRKSPSPQKANAANSLVQKGFVKDYRAMRSSENSASKLDPADIQMRTPVEAQSFIGDGRTATRTPILPSQTWKHQNSALIDDSITYDIKYLGSVIIKNLHGNQSAEEACLKLRTSTENMQKLPAITLSISWKGVKFIDTQSKKIVSVHAIRDISCCATDIEDKQVFAYISKDRATGNNYSHVFLADSEGKADEIRMTLGQAFEICYQKVMRARHFS